MRKIKDVLDIVIGYTKSSYLYSIWKNSFRFILLAYQTCWTLITCGYGIHLCRSSQARSTCLFGFLKASLSKNSLFDAVSLVRCINPCSPFDQVEFQFQWLSCVIVRMKSISFVFSRAYCTRSSFQLHTLSHIRYSFPVSCWTIPLSTTTVDHVAIIATGVDCGV